MNNFSDLLNEMPVNHAAPKRAPLAQTSVADVRRLGATLMDDAQKLNHAALAKLIENSPDPVMVYGQHGIGKTVGVKTQAKLKAKAVGRMYVEVDIAEMASSQERIHSPTIKAIDPDSNQTAQMVSIVDILTNPELYYMLLSGRPPEMHALIFAGIPTEEERWKSTIDSNYQDKGEQNADTNAHNSIAELANNIVSAVRGTTNRKIKRKKLKNEENAINDLYQENVAAFQEDKTTAIVTPGYFQSVIKSAPGGPYEKAMGTIFLDELTRVTEPFFFNLIMQSLESTGGYNNRNWRFAAAGNYGEEYIATVISDPAIKDRMKLVNLVHDPKGFLSYATDMMDPPLHPYILNYINEDSYKPFDPEWRAVASQDESQYGACCYDTSHDSQFHGKTYVAPLQRGQREARMDDAREREDHELVRCLEACEQMDVVKNSVTPRTIEKLNTGGGRGVTFEEKVRGYQQAVENKYNQADANANTRQLKDSDANINREFDELRQWVLAHVNNPPWVNGLMLYIRKAANIEQGASDPDTHYPYDSARTAGFDKSVTDAVSQMFKQNDKITASTAVKFYDVLSTDDSIPAIHINSDQCNLNAAVCKFMGFEASDKAKGLSSEEHSIIASKIYKELEQQFATQPDKAQFAGIAIATDDNFPGGRRWKLYGLTDAALTNLFKIVFVVDKFRFHFESYSKSKEQAPKEEPQSDSSWQPGSLSHGVSFPGEIPGAQGSTGDANAPEFVNGICKRLIQSFIKTLGGKFNATNLKLGNDDSSDKDDESFHDILARIPKSNPTSSYDVDDSYGSSAAPKFQLDQSSSFLINTVASSDPKTIRRVTGTGQGNSDEPQVEQFVGGARAVIACLTDIAAIICPENRDALLDIDSLLKRILKVHAGGAPRPELPPEPKDELPEPLGSSDPKKTRSPLDL